MKTEREREHTYENITPSNNNRTDGSSQQRQSYSRNTSIVGWIQGFRT